MSEATSGGAEGFAPSPASTPSIPGLAMPVLGAMAAGHFLNDLIQAIVPAAYPMIQAEYDLDYAQIGVLTMAYQFTASLLQPAVGFITDRRPADWALPAAMLSSRFLDASAVDPSVRRATATRRAHCQKP